MKYIGAHVSAAGGAFNAPINAAKIGATAFALFTKNQKQWKSAPLTDEVIAKFKQNCEEHQFSPEQILPAHGDLKKTAALASLAGEMGYELGKDVHILQNGQMLKI